ARTRAQMLAQLATAFPEQPPAAREAIGRASLRHLAWLAAEVATLDTYRERLPAYVTFAPGAEERLRELVARGRGLVYVTGHVGNWELMAQRVAVVAPVMAVARAGNEPRLNALVGRIRAAAGVGTIWREDPASARALLGTLKSGKVLGILIDQDTRVQGLFVPFFGRDAYTPRAASDLALRFGAPLLVGTSSRRGPGWRDGHEMRLTAVEYDAAPPDREAEVLRMTAACTALLEAAIRERPEEWVWMHERWKRRPPEGEASSMPKSRAITAG
ncbi:MAG TPA: lysophospholipid acyltransferase family protein, partial [Anaeromyxobacteraceae bacterium]